MGPRVIPERMAQDCVHAVLEYLPNLSGQPVPVHSHFYYFNSCSRGNSRASLFCSLPLAWHYRALLRAADTLCLIFIYINVIPSQSSRAKADRVQFLQPFLVKELIQCLSHLCCLPLCLFQQLRVSLALKGSPRALFCGTRRGFTCCATSAFKRHLEARGLWAGTLCHTPRGRAHSSQYIVVSKSSRASYLAVVP